MKRILLSVWAVFYVTACGNYFNDAINASSEENAANRHPATKDLTSLVPSSTTNTSLNFTAVYNGTDIDEAVAAIPMNDGGYLVAGNTRSYGAGLRDIILIKTDRYGTITWQRTLGGDNDDTVRQMIPHSAGGFVLLGETKSYGAGDSDLWVIKLSAAGEIEWERTYGGPSAEKAGGLVEGVNGRIIVGSSTKSFTLGLYDNWYLQISSLGKLEYYRREGYTENDVVEGVFRSNEGYFVFYGYSDNNSPGLNTGFVYDMGPDIDLGGASCIRGSKNPVVKALWQAPDNGYILIAEVDDYTASPTGTSLLVAKLDNRMYAFEWQKFISGDGNVYGMTAISGGSGSFIIGGNTNAYGAGDYDCYILEMDYSGNILKQKTIGSTGIDYLHSLHPNGKGGYILAGYTTSFGLATPAMFVTCFDGENETSGSMMTIQDMNANIKDASTRSGSFEYSSPSYSYHPDVSDTNADVDEGEMTARFY